MLNFIGTGSAFNTDLGNNAAYIKSGKNFFLIDCGSVTFEKIKRDRLLEGIKNIYVLVTHTHPDHIGSLGDLIFYGYYMVGNLAEPNVTVIAPKELEIDVLLRLMGVKKEMYHSDEINEMINISNDKFDITVYPIPVTHIDTLKSFAYKIHFNKKVMYYSGDSNEIPENILKSLNEGQIDLFYQDTCKAEYEGNPHLSLTKLDKLVNQNMKDRVYCMHLDVGFDVEKAKQLGFNVAASEMNNKTIVFDGYSHIGIQKNVCGNRPTIIGHRLEPKFISVYGTVEETMEDFDISKEKVEESRRYAIEFE
jgi:ribonuclease BN (tRNA processing enzyme)/uncharacterized protein (DUF433 family)